MVVGFDAKFDFDRLAAATTALRGGARLIGTNDDATFPTAPWPAPRRRLLPGSGHQGRRSGTRDRRQALSSRSPISLRNRVGAVEMVAGDRPSTDGRFARLVGARFGLVLTGVTPSAGHGPLDPEPDVEARDLLELVEAVPRVLAEETIVLTPASRPVQWV